MQRAAIRWAFAAALLAPACRLTDHSERDGVTTDDLNFPASGYGTVDEDRLPRIAFDADALDMGRIVQGARVEKRFTFTNTGGSPLVLADVRSSCGCTVGKDWPREPIAPGGTGAITVTFDSEGRSGIQQKTITVVTNAQPRSVVLTLTGEVVAPSLPIETDTKQP
jgi:hypothetical protein